LGWTRSWRRYYRPFSEANAYRVTNSPIKRATRRAQITGESHVTVRDLGTQRLALSARYIDSTREPTMPVSAEFERAFMPANYRVYYHTLEGAMAAPLPNAKWKYLQGLCAREGLVCTILAAPMPRAAETPLGKGEPLWWPDDSRWSGLGAAVNNCGSVTRVSAA
jgi:hypothetical protein